MLTATEEHLIPADLRAAIEFLLGARNAAEGWGDYPKVPTDIHATAQVITALQLLKHPKADELATSIASWAQWRYQQHPPTTAHEAISLLTLATADRNIDGEYGLNLRAKLESTLTKLTSEQVSTVTLAQAVLASEPWPARHRQWAAQWVDELVRRGHHRPYRVRRQPVRATDLDPRCRAQADRLTRRSHETPVEGGRGYRGPGGGAAWASHHRATPTPTEVGGA